MSHKFNSYCAQVVLLTLVSSALVNVVGAAEYRFEPSIYVQSMYDDNLLLSSPKYQSFSLLTLPRLKASVSSETWRYELDTKLSFRRMEDEQFDTDDQDIAFTAIRTTPSTIWQFSARNDRATTRTTELDSIGVAGIDGQRRDAQTFRPVVQWKVSPRHELTFGGTASNVHYDSLAFDDYDYYGADVNYAFRLNPKLQLTLNGFASSYQAQSEITPCGFFELNFGLCDSGNFESDSYGVQIGFQNQSSERLSYGASAGHRDVSSSLITRLFDPFFGLDEDLKSSSDSTGLTLDLNFRYAGEKYQVHVTGSRSVTPAGLGFLLESDKLNVQYIYLFSDTLEANLAVSGYQDSAVDSASTFSRDGFRVKPYINWKFASKWRLESGLVYRNYDSNRTMRGQKGLQVYAAVQYNFEPTVLSR